MKKYRKTLIFTSILILLPILIGVLLWDRLPETIATHFDINNEPDGWSSKPFVVFGMPLLLLALHWIGVAATLADPKKRNISDKIFKLVLWIVPAVAIFVLVMTYGYALNISMNIGQIVNILLGILFVVLGNYMPKCRQNYTVGIKIPWTLHSEENWNRTHRLAGWMFVIGGLLLMITSFVFSEIAVFVIIAVSALVPILYSFILYKKGI